MKTETTGRRTVTVEHRSRAITATAGVAVALAFIWPAILNGGALHFGDSISYLRQGSGAVDVVLAMFGLDDDGMAPAPAFLREAEGSETIETEELVASARVLRSVPFALFAWLSSASVLGTIGAVLLQSAVVVVMLGWLLERGLAAPSRDLVLAVVALAVATTTPWYASLLMPDVFAAVVVMFAMLLLMDVERWSSVATAALVAIGAFAVVAHYGHIPLAAVTVGTALAARLLAGRLGWRIIWIAAAPIVLAIGTNLVLSSMVLKDGASIAPRRLPLLLARSIQDGPARWHLEEACPDAGYAVCKVFGDDIPKTIRDVMWRNQSLNDATPEQMARVRAEEPLILWRALKSYPLQQIWSLSRNTATQAVLVKIGGVSTGQLPHDAGSGLYAGFGIEPVRLEVTPFQPLVVGSVVFGLVAIGWIWWRDGLTVVELSMLAVLCVGLLANAAIFGGLSAPVDRYQARLAWLIPAFALVLWLRHRVDVRGAP